MRMLNINSLKTIAEVQGEGNPFHPIGKNHSL